MPINWRWKFWAAATETLAPAASEMVSSTAEMLARFLPAEKMPDIPAPLTGSGGTYSPAEIGIAVSSSRYTGHHH